MAQTLLTIALVLTLAANKLNLGTAEALLLLPESAGEDDTEPDDENDSSAFSIVLEHTDGWRCGGSLVSLRNALTSGRCARGRRRPQPNSLLLALAASAAGAAPGSPARRDGARRVARLVFARDKDTDSDMADDETAQSWAGLATDIALAELESPFGIEAFARPILMATETAQCMAPADCYIARWLAASVLRIVDVALQSHQRCASVAHWGLLQERALCLTGSELCPSDWGAGVVCGGRLCGVLSGSGRPRDAVSADSAVSEASAVSACCGDVHVAQSVPRWRRFLRCAHTTHACKRDDDCVNICTEQGLLEDMEDSEEEPSETSNSTTESTEPFSLVALPSRSTQVATQHQFVFVTHTTTVSDSNKLEPSNVSLWFRRRGDTASSLQTPTRTDRRPTRTPPAARSSVRPPPPPAHDVALLGHKVGPRLEYEPNRADFKAGEYDDNTADYSSDDVFGMVGTDSTGGTVSTVAVQISSCEGPTTNQKNHSLEFRQKSEQSPVVERRTASNHQQHLTHIPRTASAADCCRTNLLYFTMLFFV